MTNTASENTTMIVARSNSRKHGLDMGGHEGASGLFIGSLAGVPIEEYAADGDHDDIDQDNDYDASLYHDQKKKNRPGQRARRAKASAIEARKVGTTWNSSINWREKKKGRNDTEDGDSGRNQISSNGGVKSTATQKIATMGKTWKEEGNAHPSWAAAAAKKSQGIAKFEGTKITFD